MPVRTIRFLPRAAAIVAAVGVLALTACTIQPGGTANDLGATVLKVAADDGSPTFEQNFNPFAGSKRIGSNFIYEPLVVVNSIDGAETPFLAESYEFVDASTIDFTIREGVTWNDGEAFTPDDVAFTFQLIKDNPALDILGAWQQIDTVTVDGNTVEFTLQAPNANAVRAIEQTIIVPEHIWADVDDPTTFADETPVGTGPYQLDQFAPNQYSLKKYPDYWQADKVAAGGLVFPASNTQLDIVSNGYDWGYAYLSDVDKTWVDLDPEHNSYWFPAGGVITLFPNLVADGPLQDVNVRLGISAALDRDAIADDAVEGYVTGAPQTGLLLPGFDAFVDPSIPDQGYLTQDTDAALAHFADAGYTLDGDKLVDASGAQLTLSITTANGYTDWLRAVQAVQSQLGAVGIEITIEQPQPAAYQEALANGQYQLAMGAFGGTGSIYEDYDKLLNSAFSVPVGEAASANFERFTDPAIDDVLNQLKVTTDDAQKVDLSYQLQNVMYSQVPTIAMYYGGLWGIYNDSKFTGWPSEADPYASPKMWDPTVLLVVTHLTAAS